jgi:hypothetical protein
MAFTRADANSQMLPKLRDRGIRRVAGAVAIGTLLWLAALLPYDRLTREAQEPSDLVPLGPNDPPVHTVEDLSRVYGISAAAQAHFRVDASGIHYLRKATREEEEHE